MPWNAQADRTRSALVTGAMTMGAVKLRPRSLFDASRQQADYLANPFSTQLGTSLRSVDPTQVRPPVELSERVEERPGLRVGFQRRRKVRRQVSALRSLWLDGNHEFVARHGAASAQCRRAEGECPLPVDVLKHSPDAPAIDRSMDVML